MLKSLLTITYTANMLYNPSFFNKNYKKSRHLVATIQSVVPTGIEPVTQGFSVLCSTN